MVVFKYSHRKGKGTTRVCIRTHRIRTPSLTTTLDNITIPILLVLQTPYNWTVIVVLLPTSNQLNLCTSVYINNSEFIDSQSWFYQSIVILTFLPSYKVYFTLSEIFTNFHSGFKPQSSDSRLRTYIVIIIEWLDRLKRLQVNFFFRTRPNDVSNLLC